jgi:clan AA aspartic protease
MIVGTVRDGREPVIRLALVGAAGQVEEVDAVIDTGFTGELTLPSSITALLGHRSRGSEEARLADGEMVLLPTYRIPVLWDGVQQLATVMEAENDPLIGMRLLHGYRLTIDAIDGGPVTIEPLP